MFVLILTVVGTGLLYVLVAKFINENNAKTWLSGYNTMSKAEREKFDIDEYLKFFKPFFKNLGIYSVLIYFISSLILDEITTIWVWTIAITIPVIYLAVYGNSIRFKKIK